MFLVVLQEWVSYYMAELKGGDGQKEGTGADLGAQVLLYKDMYREW